MLGWYEKFTVAEHVRTHAPNMYHDMISNRSLVGVELQALTLNRISCPPLLNPSQHVPIINFKGQTHCKIADQLADKRIFMLISSRIYTYLGTGKGRKCGSLVLSCTSTSVGKVSDHRRYTE